MFFTFCNPIILMDNDLQIHVTKTRYVWSRVLSINCAANILVPRGFWKLYWIRIIIFSRTNVHASIGPSFE